MKILVVFLSLSVMSLSSSPSEAQLTNLEKLESEPIECSNSQSFNKLFEFASSSDISNVSDQEILSVINENAFIKCPKEFLTNLKNQSKNIQTKVISRYFGIVHAPWELGNILNRFRNDPALGDFVKTEFSGFLKAKAPK